jgi:outer membrane protein assembly factor BamB
MFATRIVQKRKVSMKKVLCFCIAIYFIVNGYTQDGTDVINESGVHGGLIVLLNYGNETMAKELSDAGPFLVHYLNSEQKKVDAFRQVTQKTGNYGTITASLWLQQQSLPYADNTVNLLVMANADETLMNEIMRTLTPDGVVMINRNGTWEKRAKPRPDTIDDWTHTYYDASCNPVSHDKAVAPPHYLQWTAGPLWARSHGWTPSVSSMVSSGGRLISIVDEGVVGADSSRMNCWMLVARDAFNGLLLWKRPMQSWGSEGASGTPDGGAYMGNSKHNKVISGRFTMPPTINKRLVCVGNLIYATLGIDSLVSEIDARTGKTVRVFKDTGHADEMICIDNYLIVAVNPPADKRPPITPIDKEPELPPGKKVVCVDLKTGQTLWCDGPFIGMRSSLMQDPFGRLDLMAENGRLFIGTANHIEAHAIASGKLIWELPRPVPGPKTVKAIANYGIFYYRLSSMSCHNNVVLFAQPEPEENRSWHSLATKLYAFDAASGTQLWSQPIALWGHNTPASFFAMNDVVWAHEHTPSRTSKALKKDAKKPIEFYLKCIDLQTGKVLKRITTTEVFKAPHHHRCYRNRSTENYILASRRGVEFVDLKTGENYPNQWIRGGCLLGYLPCNGLLYTSTHSCRCYSSVLLRGFNALSAHSQQKPTPVADRLIKGPAYQKPCVDQLKKQDWSTYRGSSLRHGSTSTQTPVKLALKWCKKVGKGLTPPVCAGNALYLADTDSHTIHAIKETDGEAMWKTIVDGRVIAPPAYKEGKLFLGTAGGSVYSLRADDGCLAWRFLAAPQQRLIGSYNQLESAWPVSGVLVDDKYCWFAAGRSSYVDGGIYTYALERDSGKIAEENVVCLSDQKTGKMKKSKSQKTTIGLLNDIPTSNGTDIFIRNGNISSSSKKQTKPQLYTNAGFRDNTWFNRTCWMYGKFKQTGPTIILGDAIIGSNAYHKNGGGTDALYVPGEGYMVQCYPLSCIETRKPKPKWEKIINVRITAMIGSGDVIFIAGSPDMIDNDNPFGAIKGENGGRLTALSAADGSILGQMDLPSVPIWDGMIAANGNLYLSMIDGRVLCLTQKK